MYIHWWQKLRSKENILIKFKLVVASVVREKGDMIWEELKVGFEGSGHFFKDFNFLVLDQF